MLEYSSLGTFDKELVLEPGLFMLGFCGNLYYNLSKVTGVWIPSLDLSVTLYYAIRCT